MVSRVKSLCRTLDLFSRSPAESRLLCVRSGRLFPPAEAVDVLAGSLEAKRVVFVGEEHGQPEIVGLEAAVVSLAGQVAKRRGRGGRVRVFLEHFSLEQQSLLDDYAAGRIGFEELKAEYAKGGEGHRIDRYGPLIALARRDPCADGDDDVTPAAAATFHAGFVPRALARRLVSEGVPAAVGQAVERGYLASADEFVPGGEDHYRFFESLISGRSLTRAGEGPSDRYRRIFPAQAFKDSVMASVIRREMAADGVSADNKYVVILGNGHCDYGFGVPERLFSTGIVDPKDALTITARNVTNYETVQERSEEEEAESEGLKNFGEVAGFERPLPADLVYFFEDWEERQRREVKSEVEEAYDRVAESAGEEGDARLAAAVMRALGYDDDQIRIAGRDGYNYQGVGNPHKWAGIRPGDAVLDIGSGLGVDSFIAAEAAGPAGKVVGVDISKGEVAHANRRASERGVAGRVRFVRGDMERLPLPDSSVDVVVSNGAFCLAPDKARAFSEVLRVLRPGGRFSVACTTLLGDLEEGVRWPVCMRVFMPLGELAPTLEGLGFRDVEVDTSDSKMSVEVTVGEGEEGPADDSAAGQPARRESRIHVGSEEFKHLEKYDMDKLCARVVVSGTKPVAAADKS